MPNTKSAKKSMRKSEANRKRNYVVRAKVKSVIKDFLLLTKDKKVDEAKKLLPEAYSTIDKSVKTFVLHKNNAARKKSRLAAELAKIEKPKA